MPDHSNNNGHRVVLVRSSYLHTSTYITNQTYVPTCRPTDLPTYRLTDHACMHACMHACITHVHYIHTWRGAEAEVDEGVANGAPEAAFEFPASERVQLYYVYSTCLFIHIRLIIIIVNGIQMYTLVWVHDPWMCTRC